MNYKNIFFVFFTVIFLMYYVPAVGSHPKGFQGFAQIEGQFALYPQQSPLDGRGYFSKEESRAYALEFHKFAICEPEEVKDYAKMKSCFKKPPKNLSNNSRLKVLSDLYRFQELTIPAILQLKKLHKEAEELFNTKKSSPKKYGRGERSKKRSTETKIRELCNGELLQRMRFYCTYFTRDDYENLIRGGMLDAKNKAMSVLRQR